MTDVVVANLNVKHDEDRKQFFIELPGKQNHANLDYEITRRGTCLDMMHVFVPENLRRRGIAKLLVKKAVDYARENNLKVKASCSYCQDYLKKNPCEIEVK